MKKFLFLLAMLVTSSVYSQTECIETVLFKAEMDTIVEKVLINPAVYGYRMVGGSTAEFEEVEEVIVPSYTHVYMNQAGEKCKEVKKAVTKKFLRVVKSEVLPTVERYVVQEAEYQTITKTILIKDGSIKIFNKNCSE